MMPEDADEGSTFMLRFNNDVAGKSKNMAAYYASFLKSFDDPEISLGDMLLRYDG